MASNSSFNFDVSAFEKPEQRGALVYLARVAETAERYDDMARIMKALIVLTRNASEDLTTEERNLLSVAYKNVIGSRRASWRTLSEPLEDSKFNPLVDSFKKAVENELDNICAEVLDLLENYLVKYATENKATEEAQVFYLKMLGDYWRYRAESIPNKQYDQNSAKYYQQAFDLAEKNLTPTHPIRLGLALNYSVCFYEILKEPKKACDLAKQAFDLAISQLDKLDEADYKDSTLIMQLLRDNLTLWTSDKNDDREGGDVAVEDIEDAD